MKVNFYTFSKKYNSTARPTGTGTEYNCVLKTSSGVVSPTIELQLGLSSNPSAWNYCYIASYNRYYWITEWTFVGHLWIARLSVDVLATWKPYIGSTNMYVYRSSTTYDGNIADGLYPTTSNVTISQQYLTPIGKKFSDGYFVLGVYGESNNNTTMAYYSIPASDFGTFIKRVYTAGVQGGDWSGLQTGIRNAIFDVSAYIKTLKWYPFNPGEASDNGTIKVGAYDITCPNYNVVDSSLGYSFSYGSDYYAIPKHPQARSRGNYCNLAPYSSYRLVLLPFGSFTLDSTLLCNYSYLSYTTYVDAITGLGAVNIYVCTDSQGANAKQIITKTCNFGVDIPISVSQTDFKSAVGSAVGGLVSAAVGLASPKTSRKLSGLLGAGAGLANSVGELLIPSQDAISDSMGSILGIDYVDNSLTGIFFELVDEDISTNGRPLYKVTTPATIGGYIVGDSTEFSAPATAPEMEEVKRFIDAGFYYE